MATSWHSLLVHREGLVESWGEVAKLEWAVEVMGQGLAFINDLSLPHNQAP